MAAGPVLDASTLRGVEDALRIAGAGELADEVASAIASLPRSLAGVHRVLVEKRRRIVAFDAAPEAIALPWLARARTTLDAAIVEAEKIAPWLGLLSEIPKRFVHVRAELERWVTLEDCARGPSLAKELARVDAEPRDGGGLRKLEARGGVSRPRTDRARRLAAGTVRGLGRPVVRSPLRLLEIVGNPY